MWSYWIIHGWESDEIWAYDNIWYRYMDIWSYMMICDLTGSYINENLIVFDIYDPMFWGVNERQIEHYYTWSYMMSWSYMMISHHIWICIWSYRGIYNWELNNIWIIRPYIIIYEFMVIYDDTSLYMKVCVLIGTYKIENLIISELMTSYDHIWFFYIIPDRIWYYFDMYYHI